MHKGIQGINRLNHTFINDLRVRVTLLPQYLNLYYLKIYIQKKFVRQHAVKILFVTPFAKLVNLAKSKKGN